MNRLTSSMNNLNSNFEKRDNNRVIKKLTLLIFFNNVNLNRKSMSIKIINILNYNKKQNDEIKNC